MGEKYEQAVEGISHKVEGIARRVGGFVFSAIPFGAGIYIGALEGKGIDVSLTKEVALVATPFAIRMGVSSVVSSAIKTTLQNPEVYFRLDSEERYNAFETVRKNESEGFVKRNIRGLLESGALTTVGYLVGRGLAKLI